MKKKERRFPMELVLLTALGVGGATLFGTILGFIFKKISHRFSDIVLAFAAVLIHLCVKSDKKIRTDYAATRK